MRSGGVSVGFDKAFLPERGVAGATDDKMIIEGNTEEAARSGKELGELNIG